MSAFPTRRAMLAQAFGASSGVAVIDLPGRLVAVASRLGYLKDEEDAAGLLLRRHTVFPYYAPFVPEERAARCEALMRAGPVGPVHGLLGIRASRVPLPRRMQYCRSCLAHDRERYGTGYWHRRHQLSGVFICPDHGEPLLATEVLRSSSRDRLAFVSLERAVSSSDAPPLLSSILSGLPADAATRLAQASAALLECDAEAYGCGRDSRGLAGWRDRAISSLREAGYERGLAGVAVARVRRELQAYYGSGFLTAIGCATAERGDDWLARLLHLRRSASHPLHHLLVRVFAEAAGKPLGAPAGSAMGCAAIGKVRDDVTCPEGICGSVLDRQMWETLREPLMCPVCGCRFKIASEGPRLVAHGPKWEALLNKLLRNSESSLRRMSRCLFADPLTVKRHALRLGLWRPQWTGYDRALPATARAKKLVAGRSTARRRWRLAAASRPLASRKELRRLQPAAFAFLYRHDSDWLEAHSPPRRRSGAVRAYVDWGARDRQLAEQAEQMFSGVGRDENMSLRVATVARSMDRLGLIQQHAQKLPRTMSVLSRVTETRDEFALRRIAGAVCRHRGFGSAPGVSTLARDAGLNSERTTLFEPVLAAAVADLARSAQL